MPSNRLLTLFVVLTVACVALYADSQGAGIGLTVATLGLGATYLRRVLGIPVAVATTIASLKAPGVIADIVVVAACITPLLVLASFAIKFPDQASQDTNVNIW